MKKELSVSVVIPNYNYGRFLGEAIESVLAQTYSCREIIVVDDGSTDESLDILSRYEKDGIKVIKQKNRGVGAARNAGAKLSSGDLLAFLDADDFWLPQKIEKQIQCLLADEDCGFVTCGLREFDISGNIISTYTNGKQGWCADELLLIKPVVTGPGSSTLIWREVFERAGGYDERGEMHPAEDWEFAFRAARIGKIAFLPEILVAYRNHGGNGHLQIPRFERAMLLACNKIFQTKDEHLLKLKRKSYGNLYKILAGSYLHAGLYGSFVRNAGKSLFFTPENFYYFAAFPFRRLKKQIENQ